MKEHPALRTVAVASLLLVASPVLAETYAPRVEMMLRFEESSQKHPRKLTLAIPVMDPVVSFDDGGLNFSASYITHFRLEEDPRNSQGKVILKIEVLRGDRVLWQKTKKSRIKYDRDTGWECGNCTHKLSFCNRSLGALQEGDLVLFQFQFKRMPRFEPGEAADIGAETYHTCY